MVDVSFESASQIESRLQRVIRSARLDIYSTLYTFQEFSLDEFPAGARHDALAFIRDDSCWSQLVPACAGDEEFFLFRFHFPQGLDNSGFVGWLASRLKLKFGSGVFVVCGQNSKDGGIYDYWGAPNQVAKEVLKELELMIGTPPQVLDSNA